MVSRRCAAFSVHVRVLNQLVLIGVLDVIPAGNASVFPVPGWGCENTRAFILPNSQAFIPLKQLDTNGQGHQAILPFLVDIDLAFVGIVEVLDQKAIFGVPGDYRDVLGNRAQLLDTEHVVRAIWGLHGHLRPGVVIKHFAGVTRSNGIRWSSYIRPGCTVGGTLQHKGRSMPVFGFTGHPLLGRFDVLVCNLNRGQLVGYNTQHRQ